MGAKPRLTGYTGLDIYRMAKTGHVSQALRLLRAELGRHGASRMFVPDKYGDSWFDLWAHARQAELLETVEPHGIPWTVRFGATWGRRDVLERFDAKDLRRPDRRGWDAACYAMSAGHLETARWLLDTGRCRPLPEYVFAATYHRDEEILRFAVAAGAPVDGEPGGRTLLHHDCNHGWSSLVPCLVELGADVNAVQPGDGNRPLHLAAQRGSATKLCQLLIDAGADVNARNHAGETALDIAARAKQPYVAKLLRRLD
jgi:hypothetical protein